MDRLVERFPYAYLGRRQITLGDDRVTIEYKSLVCNQTWEVEYTHLDPDFTEARWGETGWGNLAFLLFLGALVVSGLARMVSSAAAKAAVLTAAACLALFAALLFSLRFLKRNYVYVRGNDGEDVVAIRATDHAKPFIEALRKRVADANEGGEPGGAKNGGGVQAGI